MKELPVGTRQARDEVVAFRFQGEIERQLRKALPEAFFSLTFVSEEEEALKLIEKIRPRLILLDCSGGRAGLNFAMWFHKSYPYQFHKPPIVAIAVLPTEQTLELELNKFAEAGVDGVYPLAGLELHRSIESIEEFLALALPVPPVASSGLLPLRPDIRNLEGIMRKILNACLDFLAFRFPPGVETKESEPVQSPFDFKVNWENIRRFLAMEF